jgi:threonine dehydrogenase-like Zn-dependent dehydrogenase
MRAAIFNGPHSISVGDRPDAAIAEPTDAVVRVVFACVCGSDLWYYRGDSPFEPGPIGHEFMGVVEDVGSDVQSIEKGDFVIAPFAFSDGTCPHCRHGVTSACGLCGVLAAHRLGAERIIALSRHADRQALAREFGATDIVEQRGEEAVEAVLEMTNGIGADAALECVGTGQAMETALAVARPGSMVGYVGVPHGVELPIGEMFFRNKGVLGGSAPVRAYIPELLPDVLEGRINPGLVLDFETDLEGVPEAYAAMDERRAIKSLVRVGAI